MKVSKFNVTLLGVLVLASILFVSCKSDKKDDPYAKKTSITEEKIDGVAITDAEMEKRSGTLF